MNLGEMTSDILARLREEDPPVRVQAADVIASINEAVEDLSEITRWRESSVNLQYIKNHLYYDMRTAIFPRLDFGMRIDEFSSNPTAGLAGAADAFRERLPLFGFAPGISTEIDTQFLRPTRCFNPQTNQWLIPSDVPDLDLHTYRMWENISSTEPQRFFIRGYWWIGLFPKTSYDFSSVTNRGYVTLYYQSIPKFLSAPSDTLDFPREFEQNIVEYALYDQFCQEGEVKKALQHWQEYVTGSEAMRQYVDERIAASSYPGLR